MIDYKELSLKLFEELSSLLAEDIDKHADLCRRYPELINIYVMNIEHNLKNEKIADYITKEEKERQIKKIWEKIKKEENAQKK